MRKIGIGIGLSFMVAACIVGIVYSVMLAGYSFYMDYTIKNEEATTYTGPINVTVNAAAMADNGYVRSDFQDVALTKAGNIKYITAMDVESSSAIWRFPYTEIEPDFQTSYTMWFGNSSGTRNQAWIASSEDLASVVNQGSFVFSGTESFSIFVEVTPAVNPGSEQIIFQKGDSYRLSLMPGPEYRFMLEDTVAGTVAATIDAEVDTKASLIAWYNGIAVGGPEYLLCDSIAGVCDQGTMTSLAIDASGTIPIIAECDCVLDSFTVRVPADWQMPAPGTPASAPITTYLYHPNCSLDNAADCPDINRSATCINTDNCPVSPLDTLEKIVLQPVIAELSDGDPYYTVMYVSSDIDYYYENYRWYFIFPPPLINAGTLSDNTQLDWVSINVYGYVLDDWPDVVDNIRIALDDLSNNWTPLINHYEPFGFYNVSSGSYTQTPNGNNWTIGELQDMQMSIGVDCDSGEISPNNSGMRLHEINEIEVCYKVSD